MEPEDGWYTPSGGDAEAGVIRIAGCGSIVGTETGSLIGSNLVLIYSFTHVLICGAFHNCGGVFRYC